MSEAVDTAHGSDAGQRRLVLVVALLVMFGALGFVSLGNLGENLVYYWDCTQIIEAGEQAWDLNGSWDLMGGSQHFR